MIVRGNTSGPTLVFIHGWPDDARLWEKQVEYFSPDYRCVLITLPGFEKGARTQFDFPELVRFLSEKIRSLNSIVTLIGHDWGAYLAYMVESEHSELINGVVALDVGADAKPKNVTAAVGIISYQSWLISAWLMRDTLPKVANGMSRIFARFSKAPRKKVDAHMNYLYYFFWRDLLLKRYKNNLLHDYKPKRPVLYLYGKAKPFMFHSEEWLKLVTECEACEVHGIKGAGHWFMWSHPETVNQLISNWLLRREKFFFTKTFHPRDQYASEF